MIRQQKLEHRSLRLFNLFALGGHNHAVGAGDGARRLQLGHLLDTHETHATRSLQGQVSVITERRNRESVVATHVDQARGFRNLKVAAVDSYFDEFSAHEIFTTENTEKNKDRFRGGLLPANYRRRN